MAWTCLLVEPYTTLRRRLPFEPFPSSTVATQRHHSPSGRCRLRTNRVQIDWAGELINRALEQEEALAVDEGGNRYKLTILPAESVK